MTRTGLYILTAAIVCLYSTQVFANALELSLILEPSMLHDDVYEAFSDDNLYHTRLGADLRIKTGEVDGWEFLPVLSYRFASDSGTPGNMLNNELFIQDFLAGLRVRKELAFCLAIFIEAKAGLLWADLDSSISEERGYEFGDRIGTMRNYSDDAYTWTAGGLVGIETYISKKWLESRGVYNFNFGGELGLGYVRRGDLSFSPKLAGGDEHALPVTEAETWGDVNLSAFVIQLGIFVRFL